MSEHKVRWSLGVLGGLALIVAGVFLLFFAGTASLLSVGLLSAALIVGGILEITAAARTEGRLGAALLTGGVLSVVVGLVAIANPAVSLAVIALLVAVDLLVAGLHGVIASLVVRGEGWGRSLFYGAINLALGLWLVSVWPGVSLVLAGTLLAVRLISAGGAVVSLSLAGRRIQRRLDAPV